MDDITKCEEHLISSMVINPACCDEIQAEVSASDFANKPLGKFFEMLVDMRDSGRPISDQRLVLLQLRATGLLEKIGGLAAVGRITEELPNGAHGIYYARQIRRASMLRKLSALAATIHDEARAPDANPSVIASTISAQLQQMQAQDTTGLSTLYDAMGKAIEKMELAASGRSGVSVPTGFFSLDSAIGGFYAGELIIVAARPSIGKSSFAWQVGMHNATKDRRVLFLSLEMDDISLANREFASELGTEVRCIRSGAVTPAQIEQAKAIREAEKNSPMEIFYGRSLNVSRLKGLARLVAARKNGLRMIVLDYLGLMSGDSRKKRWEQIAEVSGELKTIAQELQVPLVVCCQVGREAESKVPQLNQLRDSGSIEQDADVVIFLHRETRESTSASLIIAKNRNGSTGEMQLGFDPQTTSFFDREVFS